MKHNHDQISNFSEGGVSSQTLGHKTTLSAQCQHCFGLCCVAFYFKASEGFPVDKNPGQPCPNLQSDFKCCVHEELTTKGLKGCSAYDCFGAGQKVSQVTFNKKTWRENPEQAKAMFDVFLVMRQLHEMLWYLEESLKLKTVAPIYHEVELMLKETEHLTYLSVEALQKIDLTRHRFKVNQVLMKVSEGVRTEARRDPKNQTGRFRAFERGADLVGKDLMKMDLVGANLRGAYLIAANLSGMNLSGADVIGADFRDANLSGAKLSQTLFMTQAQLNCAKGDHKTELPNTLLRPTQWLKS